MNQPSARGPRLLVISAVVVIAMLVSGPALSWFSRELRVHSVPRGPALWLAHPAVVRRGSPAGHPNPIVVDGGDGAQTTFHWTASGTPTASSSGTVALNTGGRATFNVVPLPVTAPRSLEIHLSGIAQPLIVRVIPR